MQHTQDFIVPSNFHHNLDTPRSGRSERYLMTAVGRNGGERVLAIEANDKPVVGNRSSTPAVQCAEVWTPPPASRIGVGARGRAEENSLTRST